jgi:hypothetical protein
LLTLPKTRPGGRHQIGTVGGFMSEWWAASNRNARAECVGIYKLAEESDWILRRLSEKPDITGRELLAELRDRDIDVSYYAVWNFLDRSGLSYKKNAARGRTGPA